ncbi:hypothetical protein [Leifsonia xyli]|uniref:hypothetical protein n=1 Tax=Leifsonia xyli TaxID=1575 RepID=UPI0003FCB39F|nr:hypothetical protein [Leifsonia xyli]
MRKEYTTGGHYVIVGGEGAAFCSADTPVDIVKRLYRALIDERGAEGVIRAILALDHSAISSLGVVVRGAETWHVLVAGVAEAVVLSAGEERSIHGSGRSHLVGGHGGAGGRLPSGRSRRPVRRR